MTSLSAAPVISRSAVSPSTGRWPLAARRLDPLVGGGIDREGPVVALAIAEFDHSAGLDGAERGLEIAAETDRHQRRQRLGKARRALVSPAADIARKASWNNTSTRFGAACAAGVAIRPSTGSKATLVSGMCASRAQIGQVADAQRAGAIQPVDPDPERARMEIAELLVQATPRGAIGRCTGCASERRSASVSGGLKRWVSSPRGWQA